MQDRQNGDRDLSRILYRLRVTANEVMKELYWLNHTANYIKELAERDVRDGMPEHYEEIVALIAEQEKMVESLRLAIDDAIDVRKSIRADAYSLQMLLCDAEAQAESLRDLKATMTTWLIRFEAIPEPVTEAEEKAAEAEKREAYATGGASLVRGSATE